MTPHDKLQTGGVLLYGATSWQVQLARDLDVSERTVRRWKKGQSEVPPGVVNEVLKLCQARAGQLMAFIGDATK